MATVLMVISVPSALAYHDVIVASDVSYTAVSPWNGVRVYLSSPRHADSGSRGECSHEENINGHRFNIIAADGLYYLDQRDTTSEGRSLRARHYNVKVSANSRDNNWLANRTASNNWNARVHLVTHSNAASGGCGATPQHLLAMYKSGNTNSVNLSTRVLDELDPVVPGGRNSWSQNLGELDALAQHRAYVELFFHTSLSANHWFNGDNNNGDRFAWRYGRTIDGQLGYPRG